MIAASGISYAILRPGFVIAPGAFGGSAMVRALAALPFRLSAADASVPFQPVAVADISATIAWLASRATDDRSTNAATWELMQKQPVTLGEVIEAFARSLGSSGLPRIPLPAFLLDLGVMLGDLVSWLGWKPPMRTTAISELRRGVRGDPSAWTALTGLIPTAMAEVLGRHPATIQDKWFARLYLTKALIIASLVVFWIASGFIALFISYDAAAGMLRSHAFPPTLVAPITILTSLMDIATGVLIAFRRTVAFGLIWGILASLGYMAGAAILTPDLWIEPLGALVKTGPAIVLMLVALLILDNR
jgi:DoxX-like family